MKLIELLNEILNKVNMILKQTKFTKILIQYKQEDLLTFEVDKNSYAILFLNHNSDFNIILWKDRGSKFILKYEGEYYDNEQEIINILLKEIHYFKTVLRYEKLKKINTINE